MWWKFSFSLVSPYLWLAVFLFFAFLSSIFNFLPLLIFSFLGLGIAFLIRRKKIQLKTVFAILAIFAILQSLVAISQFVLQSDLGLQKFGESPLGRDIPGVAKIEINGQKFIRGYGFFPHPNILAASLILGLISLYFLFFRIKNWSWFSVLSVVMGFFLVLSGLTLTFSRSGWLAGFLITGILIIHGLRSSSTRKAAWRLAFLLTACCLALGVVFYPYIFSRLSFSADEPAVSLRSDYNRIGWEIIKENPFGVGIGNQVYYAVEKGLYQDYGLTEKWQWQPIHNFYLLMTSELGVLGAMAFMAFIFSTLYALRNSYLQHLPALLMLLSLLMLGLFDHYLWDIWYGQLLFWSVIGILLAASPRSSKPTPGVGSPISQSEHRSG